MTGWISSISGILFGGGWGTFASLLLGVVVMWYLAKVWKKAKQDKAHKDTKDKEVQDHKKQIEKNQKHQKQAGGDDKASDKKLEEIIEKDNH